MKTNFDWQKIIEADSTGNLAPLIANVRQLIEHRVEQVYLIENKATLLKELGECEYLAALARVESILTTESYPGSVEPEKSNMQVLIQSLASASNEKYRDRYIKNRGQQNYHDLIQELSAAILKTSS